MRTRAHAPRHTSLSRWEGCSYSGTVDSEAVVVHFKDVHDCGHHNDRKRGNQQRDEENATEGQENTAGMAGHAKDGKVACKVPRECNPDVHSKDTPTGSIGAMWDT